MAKKAGRGRRPAGPAGEKTSEYRALGVRMSESGHELLAALAAVVPGASKGRIVEQGLEALAASLSADQRRALEALRKARRG